VALLDLVTAGAALAPAAAIAGTLGDGEGPGPALVASAGVGALIAGLAVVAGMGLLKLEEYGRRTQLGLAIVGLPFVPVGTAVSILLWIYLTRPGVRLLFSGRSDLSPDEATTVARAARDQGLALAAAVLGLATAALVVLMLASVFVAGFVSALQSSSGTTP
jgi:hypothetical protein